MKRRRGKYVATAAVCLAAVAAVVAAGYTALRQRAATIVLTPRSVPGPVLEYEPASKSISFDVAFTAENRGREDEPVVAIRGSLDSGRGPLMYFTNRDIHCTVDGQTVAALISGGRQQMRCRLLHNFTSSSLAQMTAPGPLMLHVRVQGQRDALGAVRYCINATDDFWRAFLASQSRSSRLILNPENCK